MRATLLCLSAFLLLAPRASRADRRDLYATVSVEPQRATFHDPMTESASSTTVIPGSLGLSVFYGLTNTIHFGGAFHYSQTKNVAFEGVSVTEGGWPASGTGYADLAAYSLTALGQYRLDTGYSLAPVVRLEAGVASLHYTSAEFRPEGSGYAMAYPDKSKVAFEGRASLLFEYRFRSPQFLPVEHLVASVGLGYVVHPGSDSPSGLSVPLSIGCIW
jgi:hypothetical protein